jgi:hypothetical protein
MQNDWGIGDKSSLHKNCQGLLLITIRHIHELFKEGNLLFASRDVDFKST